MAKIWTAANTATMWEFNNAMQAIEAEDAGAAAYLRDVNLKSWATSSFPAPRFGCTTSNSAD